MWFDPRTYADDGPFSGLTIREKMEIRDERIQWWLEKNSPFEYGEVTEEHTKDSRPRKRSRQGRTPKARTAPVAKTPPKDSKTIRRVNCLEF